MNYPSPEILSLSTVEYTYIPQYKDYVLLNNGVLKIRRARYSGTPTRPISVAEHTALYQIGF